MARFRTTSAFYSDAVGIGRVRAGTIICDSQAVGYSYPGDLVWTGLNAKSLPAGFTPLDTDADVMRAASRWAGTPMGIACTGTDSIDG